MIKILIICIQFLSLLISLDSLMILQIVVVGSPQIKVIIGDVWPDFNRSEIGCDWLFVVLQEILGLSQSIPILIFSRFNL